MIGPSSATKKYIYTHRFKPQVKGERKSLVSDDNGHNTQEPNIGAVFDQHIKHEFQDHDVDATMETMTKEPYVHHVPIMTGGIGYAGVYNFYKNHFIGKMPDDTKIVRISRTIGKDSVVDELILTFTHDREIDFMLPGIPHTGRYIELPHVAIMNFKDGRIAHEHIYWIQASLLVQVGLLDPKLLPVTGQEQANRLLELSQQADNNTNSAK